MNTKKERILKMNAKVEKLDNNKVKLEITIEADKFEEGLQKAANGVHN